MRTEIDLTQAFVDNVILAWNADECSPIDAAKAKYWASEMQGRVLDRCLQLFGGYGYMLEYPVARAYVDGRIQRIFGGSNEIMLDMIGRSLVSAGV